MPIGVIVDAAAVVVGGLVGSFLGDRLSREFRDKLNMVLGICALGMGVSSIAVMENLPPVVFSVIAGTCIGHFLKFGSMFQGLAVWLQRIISPFIRDDSITMSRKEFDSTLVTVIILICTGALGIYGSIVAGMSGDHSLLLTKSFLDLSVAVIFACILGKVVSVVAIPQAVLLMVLYLLGGIIFPLTTPVMINDFKAVGGFILLATGLRILRLADTPAADMIPAMILVMPVSAFWTNVIVPLLH